MACLLLKHIIPSNPSLLGINCITRSTMIMVLQVVIATCPADLMAFKQDGSGSSRAALLLSYCLNLSKSPRLCASGQNQYNAPLSRRGFMRPVWKLSRVFSSGPSWALDMKGDPQVVFNPLDFRACRNISSDLPWFSWKNSCGSLMFIVALVCSLKSCQPLTEASSVQSIH